MQCNFEKEEIRPDGFFVYSACVNDAKILIINDLCYGLCYGCAYEKLKKAYQETQAELINKSCGCSNIMKKHFEQAPKGDK